MAGYCSGVTVVGVLGAFIGWILAAQYAPIIHFLPYAFLLGVLSGAAVCLLLLSFASRSDAPTSSPRLPSTTALELSKPVVFDSELRALNARRTYCPISIPHLPLPVAGSLDDILGSIVREYVQTWLSSITRSKLFSNQVDHALRSIVSEATAKVYKHDLAHVMFAYALPIFNDHLANFIKAESKVRSLKHRRLSEHPRTDELAVEIAAQFKSGHLHPAASLASSKSAAPQQRHLRTLMEQLLQTNLATALMRSPSVGTVVREIVACAVFCPSLKMLSDPDFIFRQIQVHGQSLLKASRNQLHERRGSFATRRRLSDPTTAPAKPLSRSALLPADSRASYNPLVNQYHLPATNLRDVLYDVAGLSYFMEFMDQFDLVCYVQFWITTDGFQASLNSDLFTSQAHPLESLPQSWTESDRLMILRIDEKFLSQAAIAPLCTERETVTAFLQGGSAASGAQYAEACAAVSKTQARVYQTMETTHFPLFQQSDIYQQWTGSAPPRDSQEDEIAYSGSEPLNSERLTQSAATKVALLPDSVTHQQRNPASSRNWSRHMNSTAPFAAPRRSLDESSNRKPLFEDQDDGSDHASASVSLASDDINTRQSTNEQNGLSGVYRFATDELRPFPALKAIPRSSSEANVRRQAQIAEHISGEIDRPSLDSLGLLGTPSKRTVFSTDDLFGENENLWEDDEPATGDGIESAGNIIREAKPGDLGLPEAVESLNLEIEKVEAQHKVLRSLLSKAELTNNTAELKILKRSIADIEFDLRHKELQRQQFLVQQSDNSLFRKTSASIASVHIGHETDGREYAMYDVQLQRRDGENSLAASWTVNKRYSEFHELHKRLRTRFPYVREFPFPKRQVVATLQTEFVQRRRHGLEKYLGRVLSDAILCQDLEVRSFLSEQPIRLPRLRRASIDSNRRDVVSRLYGALSAALEDFVGNASVLDQLSVAGHNLISAATAASGIPVPGWSSGLISFPEAPPSVASDAALDAEAQAEISAFNRSGYAQDNNGVAGTPPSASTAKRNGPGATFIDSIARCFSTLFQTENGNNWLRGRAVVIVLQQIVGGTVERRIRESFASLTTPDSLSRYLDSLREALWPAGGSQASGMARSKATKARTQRDAEEVLCTLLRENTGSFVGRAAANDAGRRLVRCLANERLNLHLAYTLVDSLIPLLLDADVKVGS